MTANGISTTLRRPRAIPTFVGWSAAVLVVVALGLLCWDQIRRTLGAPVDVMLTPETQPHLPRPRGGTATINSYGVDGVDASLTHVSTQLQWLIGSEIALKFILMTAVILVFGVVWVRTSTGRPFSRLVTVSLAVLAVLAFVLGSGLDALDSLITQREAFEAIGNSGGPDFYYNGGFQISGLGLLFGLGIGVLASAFAIGAKLTRETDGLV
ncbi:MAG TPA: hypothetical protein VGI56_11115 [Galbitalea sp.]|jgi:hypothetical protein